MFYPFFSGYIYPDRANPIVPNRNNQGAIANYTFYMSLQTSIYQSPTIIITFPLNEYATVMSTTTCTAEITQSSTTNRTTCDHAANVITIPIDPAQFPLIESGSIIITIYNVANPINLAGMGTGNFQVMTQSKGGIAIDKNNNFESIGISAPYITCTKN